MRPALHDVRFASIKHRIKCRTDSPLNWKRLPNCPNQHFSYLKRNSEFQSWYKARIWKASTFALSVTRDCAQAALWDTAIKFSPQSRAMTSPDHLEVARVLYLNQSLIVIMQSQSKYKITCKTQTKTSPLKQVFYAMNSELQKVFWFVWV